MIDRAMQPVELHERIQLIDILRGFALLGILLVNMHLFSHPVYAILLAQATGRPSLTASPSGSFALRPKASFTRSFPSYSAWV